MNTAHDEFVAGQVYTDSVTVSTIDGTSLELKVEITGTNDAAQITANEVLKFESDAALTVSGKLEVSDIDSPTVFNAGTFTGAYGSLTLNSSGAWSYTASSAHNEFIANGLYTDDSLVHLSTAGIQQVNGGNDNLGTSVNAREDTVKLDFSLADATMKTSADGQHVEVTFLNDASTLKTLSNVEAVQFNDALVRIIGADGYKNVADATNTNNASHVNVGVDAVFVSVASGYDALIQHASVIDLSNTYAALTDAYNHH
jgi:VCBS repeat-containing protein